MKIDRRQPFRCPHCGALIVWGPGRVPLDVVAMQATTTPHLMTCKQPQGWSKK